MRIWVYQWGLDCIVGEIIDYEIVETFELGEYAIILWPNLQKHKIRAHYKHADGCYQPFQRGGWKNIQAKGEAQQWLTQRYEPLQRNHASLISYS